MGSATGRPGWVARGRRGLARLGMAAAAVVAVGVGVVVAAGTAGAANRVGIYLDAYKLPPGTTISFADIGGNCDGSKIYPTLVVPRDGSHGGTLRTDLFTAKNTGSCAFEGSNAQFKLSLRTPQTTTGSVNINVTQKDGAGTYYAVHCYDVRDVGCYGDDRGTKPSNGSVSVYMSLGPVTGPYTAAPAGYTFCAVEGDTCSFATTTASKATIAFGTNGSYVYAKRGFVGGGVPCTVKEFGSDPVPGKTKACFYKNI
jgi:hypothetical protein